MKNWISLCGMTALFIFMPAISKGQQVSNNIVKDKPGVVDTTLIKSFRKHITVHAFLSRKYTSIQIPGSVTAPAFRYLPNNTFSVGMGTAYRYYSLSLAIGLGGLNKDLSLRGETKSLDLQTNIYTKKWIADFGAQFYKGYYLSPRNFVSGQPDYWLAPELRLRLFGASAYYILNHDRFSYRASNALNEWQLKSAGSFLIGLEAYAGVFKNETGIVPKPLSTAYPQGQVNSVRFTQIGPGAGYSHHFVMRRHFFVSVTGTVNPVFGFTRESTDYSALRKVYIFPNYNLRAAAGYFSERWSSSVAWAHTNLVIRGAANNRPYQIQTGNFRLTVAYRFLPGKRTRKLLQLPDPFVEKVIPIK